MKKYIRKFNLSIWRLLFQLPNLYMNCIYNMPNKWLGIQPLLKYFINSDNRVSTATKAAPILWTLKYSSLWPLYLLSNYKIPGTLLGPENTQLDKKLLCSLTVLNWTNIQFSLLMFASLSHLSSLDPHGMSSEFWTREMCFNPTSAMTSFVNLNRWL